MEDAKSIRLGFVGLRNVGMNHVKRALELPGVAIAAVADTDAGRLDAARRLIGADVACHSTADGLFASRDVDAVVLATPNHLHAPMSIAAMRQGKSVLVEKPMGMDPAEGKEMIDVRNEAGVVLMVGMNQRFRPEHVTARKRLSEGAIGSILQCRTRWLLDRPFKGLWDRGDWFLSAATSGGGPLLDLGVHRLDLALYLIGHPQVESVTGVTSYGVGRHVAASRGKAYELEDYGLGLLRLTDGSVLTLEASYFLNIPGKIQDTVIVGTDGCLNIGDKVTLTQWNGDEAETTELPPDELTATSCVEHFCRALRREEDLVPTAEQGLQALMLIDAIYRSARTRTTLALDTEPAVPRDGL